MIKSLRSLSVAALLDCPDAAARVSGLPASLKVVVLDELRQREQLLEAQALVPQLVEGLPLLDLSATPLSAQLLHSVARRSGCQQLNLAHSPAVHSSLAWRKLAQSLLDTLTELNLTDARLALTVALLFALQSSAQSQRVGLHGSY
jgi:hypothetical protein